MAYTYEYPRPAVTADCVVITKERLRVGAKAGMAEPKVLLIERCVEPFKVLHDHDEEGWEIFEIN